jgi:arsenite methyltransferase
MATAIHEKVAQRYGQIARTGGSCCGSGSDVAVDQHASLIGYDLEQIGAMPEGANLGLGCGNPTSLTMIEPGMTVVDLGSGAGIDCFLAARHVGPQGRVIGVDMTDAMLDKARDFAARNGYGNVEFRKGYIEHLPLEDASVDLIISNCVINLSPDKGQVFSEIARVLKLGGRAAISDIVLLKPLPEAIVRDVEAYIGCIAGAELVGSYLQHAFVAGLNIDRAARKTYDVVNVLGCSPEASKLIDKLPADFDGGASVASLDLVLLKPEPRRRSLPVASGCC